MEKENVCINCGTQVRVTNLGLRHVDNRSLFCDTVGTPPKGKLRWAEVEGSENDDIFVPSSGEEARLITAISDELMQRSVNIAPGSCVYLAGYIAERVVKEGWSFNG